ncbi:MAG TPA: metallophosphoesterase [Vicinamibacterales bacterium]|nr:metallophosphoesterase [Vicinamibacterales bacterium]
MSAPSRTFRCDVRLAGLAVALAVCLFTVQCSGGNAGTGTPTGPTIPGPSNPNPNPTPAGPETFVGAGDIAICGGNAEATARQLDGIGGTVFTLGDNAYSSGSRADFQNCYEPTWGRHKSRTRPTPGNHDYATPGAAPYYDYFGANAGPAGVGYYSFDLGAWHIISLNSNVGADGGSPQSAWLRGDLAANAAARCTLAYWHHPLFSSGPNGTRETPVMREMFRLLYNANVDLVLVGHDHTYERFAPQDADGRLDTARGIRQFVVGTGGVPLYDFEAIKPNSEVRLKSHGVIKLTLSSDHYQWDFLALSGAGDSGSTTCH